MAANAYLRIGRLATHPAFSAAAGGMLVCPLCAGEPEQFRTTRVAAYDRHFVAHDPDEASESAWEFRRLLRLWTFALLLGHREVSGSPGGGSVGTLTSRPRRVCGLLVAPADPRRRR